MQHCNTTEKDAAKLSECQSEINLHIAHASEYLPNGMYDSNGQHNAHVAPLQLLDHTHVGQYMLHIKCNLCDVDL